MPEPGDRYAQAFTVEPGQCWGMIHDRQGQATHCAETPSWTGWWFSPRGDGTWWRVWSCPDHLDGLTGVREFGRGAFDFDADSPQNWRLTTVSGG